MTSQQDGARWEHVNGLCFWELVDGWKVYAKVPCRSVAWRPDNVAVIAETYGVQLPERLHDYCVNGGVMGRTPAGQVERRVSFAQKMVEMHRNGAGL